jgi:hypothetical protein
MTNHSENTKTATCDNNVLANRIFTGIKDWKINDILEDKNGKRYLIGWRNEKFVAVHPPTCGSEREGECKYDYLEDMINSRIWFDLQKIGNYDKNPNLLDAPY